MPALNLAARAANGVHHLLTGMDLLVLEECLIIQTRNIRFLHEYVALSAGIRFLRENADSTEHDSCSCHSSVSCDKRQSLNAIWDRRL